MAGHKALLLLPMLGGLGGCALSPARPLERDVWHAFVADEQRYGYQHTVVTALPQGRYRYVSDSRILLDVLGVQKQEHAARVEYIVTSALQPLSVTADIQQPSGPTRTRGCVEQGRLRLLTREGALVRTRTLDLDPDVIPDACLDDWLRAQPRATERVSARVLRADGWTVEPATFTRQTPETSGATWRLELTDAGECGTVCYDRDGVLREMQLEVPRLHLQRCSAAEAADIVHRRLAGRDMLTYPLDQDVGGPQRLIELTVKLTWRDIPFDRFELEDQRQHIVTKSVQDGRYEAVLKIAPPPAAPPGVSFPISDAQFAPYLGETQYIKPADERIAAAAREAVAGKSAAFEAVKALSAFVSGHIQGVLVAETLTGPEILERKTGKCSEYAILFASLARAVGIPTRIVLGERLVEGQWMGHMWNEAYVGDWVTVDASADEVGASFSLLKFIHSARVRGTQPLRWALTDSLELSIVGFRSRPHALAARYRTGIEGPVYTNVDYACRLTAPEPDWALEDKSKPGVALVRFRVPQHDDVQIHFVAFAAPAGLPPQSLIDARLNHFQSYKDFVVLKNEPYAVADAAAHTLRFRRAAGDDESGTVLTTEVVWVRGSHGFLLNLIAEESAHDACLANFEKLLAAFEGLPEE